MPKQKNWSSLSDKRLNDLVPEAILWDAITVRNELALILENRRWSKLRKRVSEDWCIGYRRREAEAIENYLYHHFGMSRDEIATAIGCDPSTVYRAVNGKSVSSIIHQMCKCFVLELKRFQKARRSPSRYWSILRGLEFNSSRSLGNGERQEDGASS